MGTKKSKLQLTKETMKVLLVKTKFNEDEINSWHRSFIMDCPDGKLTKKQFLKVFRIYFDGAHKAKKFCEKVFKSFDLDHNGSIDFKEFLLAINLSINGSVEEKLSNAFNVYDLNHDGYLDVNEITKIIKYIYDFYGEDDSASEKAKIIIKKLDKNGDNVVSTDEFIQGCMKDEFFLKLYNSGLMKVV